MTTAKSYLESKGIHLKCYCSSTRLAAGSRESGLEESGDRHNELFSWVCLDKCWNVVIYLCEGQKYMQHRPQQEYYFNLFLNKQQPYIRRTISTTKPLAENPAPFGSYLQDWSFFLDLFLFKRSFTMKSGFLGQISTD